MADLSQIPIDELMRMREGMASNAPAQPTGPDLGGASLDELLALRERISANAQSQQPQPQPWSGSVLPLSTDGKGNLQFDSNAGIVGSMKRAITLPGDVYAGRIDPMSEEGISRANELAGLATPVNPAVRAGGYGIPGARSGVVPGAKPVPSAEELKAAASTGYDEARNLGVEYSSDAVAKMAQGIRAELERDGVIGELAPKTFAILEKLSNPPANSTAPLTGLEAARRAAGHARKDFNNPTDQLGAARLVERLDNWMAVPPESAVVAGPVSEAGKILSDARGNYAAAARSEKLSGAEERASLNAAAANSGLNVDNAIRARARDIITRPKEAAGFVEGELQGLENVVRGGAARNTARAIGNMLGGGGGLGAMVAGTIGGMAGGALGGPAGTVMGAATPMAGALAKAIANRMTRGAMERVDEATRMRSPLYEAAPPAMTPAKDVTWGERLGKALSQTHQSLSAPLTADEKSRAIARFIMEGGA